MEHEHELETAPAKMRFDSLIRFHGALWPADFDHEPQRGQARREVRGSEEGDISLGQSINHPVFSRPTTHDINIDVQPSVPGLSPCSLVLVTRSRR